jgi:hypothetical protein
VNPAQIGHLLHQRVGKRLFGEDAFRFAQPLRIDGAVIELSQIAVRRAASE